MSATLTWLHLSDLHCCPARTGWDADRLRRTLSKDLAELIERDELRPDFLFFTGDAAYGHLPDDGLPIDEALDGWRDLGRGDEAASRLDRVLVYGTVERGGFTLEEASRRLDELGFPAPGERLRRSLQRLELAYVLRREGRRYTFPVPLFVERLREQDPAVLLENELRA